MTRLFAWIKQPMNLLLASFAALMFEYVALVALSVDVSALAVPLTATAGIVVALIKFHSGQPPR